MAVDCKECEPTPMVDNKVCPYRMSDGRNFTDYRTRCTIAYQFKEQNKFKSSYDQRQFLIKNADKLMKDNLVIAEKINKCGPCFDHKEPGTMLPEKNMVKCNKTKCEFTKADPSGLGTGRNYN